VVHYSSEGNGQLRRPDQDHLRPASGLIFQRASFNVGDTPVNCAATDCSNNQSLPCSFTVTVTDCDAPVITCRSGVMQCTDAGLCSAVMNGIDPVVNDNCPGVTLS
jgi:hypothetical protein